VKSNNKEKVMKNVILVGLVAFGLVGCGAKEEAAVEETAVEVVAPADAETGGVPVDATAEVLAAEVESAVE
jgi:uncharacterized protein YcfL